MRQMIALFLIAVLSVPAAAWQPNLKFGPLALHPSYELRTVYDDNIYRVPPDKASGARVGGGVLGSWIIENNLGLKADMAISDAHKVSADYKFESDIYETQSKANNAINQYVTGMYDFKGSRTQARAWDSYANTQDPQFQPNNTVTGDLVARERRWQNTGGAMGEYALGDKFFFGLSGQDTVHKYLSPSLGANLNRSELLFGVKTGYKVQPKTRVFMGAHRQIVHYSAGRRSNHKDWLTDFGIEGQLTGKLKGQVRTGLEYREYDFDASNPAFDRVKRLWSAKAGLNFAATERTTLDLVANRGLNESASSGSGGNYFTSTGVNLQAKHNWQKFVFSAGGGIQIDKYAEAVTLGGFTAVRRDDNYLGSASVDYKIQEWLVATLDYRHLRRHSTFTDQFNYKNNQTGLGIKVQF